MECAIFRRGEPAGALRIEDDGLYRVLTARVSGEGEILRLYLRGESFGVLCPEDGALCLRRRVSRTRLPELPESAVAWCEADGRWLPADGGLRRYTPLGEERAIPWRTDAPMAFPAAPEKLRPLRLEGAYYLVFSDQYTMRRMA